MENHKIKGFVAAHTLDYDNKYDFTKAHRHSYFEIMLFENSLGGVNNIDFIEYPIQSKSLHIIAPNQVHLLKRKKEKGVLIQFTKEYLIANITSFHIEWLFSLQSNPMTLLTENQYNKLYTVITNLCSISRENKTFTNQLTEHYFLYVIFEVLEIVSDTILEKKVNNNALEFLKLAENQFKENRIVDNFAQQMNMPIRKLRAEVNDTFGKSPLHILHELLALEIKRLLSIEDLSQKEISYLLNFDSPASYTRFVKNRFNCSPTELKTRLS